VKAAKHLCYVFTGIVGDDVNLIIKGVTQKFKILDIFEFKSVRQRSSIVVRNQTTNEIFLYCYGADS